MSSKGIIPLVRPPGAIDEKEFLLGCTKCEECVKACPHGAIEKAPATFGSRAGGPVINAKRQPCLMCSDFPCVVACEPAVLRNDLVPKIGEAHIVSNNCLAHMRTLCTVCAERCPEDGAIVLDTGKPRVVTAKCTGCGICAFVCPAPQRAIVILPLRSRGETRP